jgi:hypothetical protein
METNILSQYEFQKDTQGNFKAKCRHCKGQRPNHNNLPVFVGFILLTKKIKRIEKIQHLPNSIIFFVPHLRVCALQQHSKTVNKKLIEKNIQCYLRNKNHLQLNKKGQFFGHYNTQSLLFSKFFIRMTVQISVRRQLVILYELLLFKEAMGIIKIKSIYDVLI